MKSNFSKSFGLIRIDWIHSDWSDWPQSFALKFWIDSNWPDSDQFWLIRIDRIYSDVFGLTGFIRITSTDWFWMGLALIWIEDQLRIRSEWNCLVRIEIHSEPIRYFSNYSGICNRIKQFNSDLIRRSFSIRINQRPIQNQSEIVIRMNPVNPN